MIAPVLGALRNGSAGVIRSGALVVAAAWLGPAGSADAHHFKGLPHFSYFENYPQVPQDEFLGQAGDFEYSLVLYDFQGLKQEDKEQPNDAHLYLIIYNLRENRVYDGPVRIEVLDRGKPVHSADFDGPKEECVYSMKRELPETGRYALAVTQLDGDRTRAEIPFRLSSQKVPWGKWITGGLVLLVAVVAVGSRRARVVMDRAEALRREQHA
ncbi:hypothetical protein K8I85_09100 [bacterium]|nr:hypothetical protein [bacterium]